MCLNLENAMLKQADHVICISEKQIENFERLGAGKVSCITNGYDEEDFAELPPYEKTEKFTLVHNGVLYVYEERNHEPVLTALGSLIAAGKTAPDKIVYHMGSFVPGDRQGVQLTNKKIAELGLQSQAKFTPYMSHKDSLRHSSKADLLVNILGKSVSWRNIYPDKIWEYLRLGKPILTTGPKDSSMEYILAKIGAGINAEFDDTAGIKEFILEHYNAWLAGTPKVPKGTDITEYERRNLVRRHAEVFERVVSENG